VYAIKACILENINRNIFILSYCQFALKALCCSQVNSKLVCDCLQSLRTLTEHNRLQLIKMPGFVGKKGVEIPYVRPQPSYGNSGRTAGGSFGNFRNGKCLEYCKSIAE
jgi:hypothetical protein